MRIDLKYGEGVLTLDADMPFSEDILTPKSVVSVPDINGTLCAMLDGPNGLGPVLDGSSRPCTITVIIDDPSSQTPTDKLLSSLVPYLETKCVDSSEITLLVASPLDGQLSLADTIARTRKASPWDCRIEVHNPSSPKQLVELGDTPTHGTPVAVNRTLMDSELRVSISSIVPDGFTGATGGSMSVLPGVAGELTCEQNRRLCMAGPSGLAVVDRPVSVDMRECADMAGVGVILNAVLDWTGTVAHVTAGTPSCWSAGVDIVRGLSQVTLRKRADIAVVSAGGAPYDRTLYRATDSLIAGMAATRTNGAIVLVAECDDGVGPSGFLNGISNQTSREGLAREAERSFELGMEKASLFWHVLESRRLVICTRLRRSLVEEKLHCEAVRDPQEAMEAARSAVGGSTGVVVLPSGNHTLPVQL